MNTFGITQIFFSGYGSYNEGSRIFFPNSPCISIKRLLNSLFDLLPKANFARLIK